MEQFHSLVKRFNLGHRIYWWQMCRFMQYIDKNKAFEYFQKFWKTGRDALSDCRACERCYAVRMYLLMGDEAGAEEHAKPIKSRHIRFCGDAPHLMLLAYIEYAMDKGNLKMAIPYARELKRIGHRDRSDLSYIGAVLRCYAYSDLESGIELMANSFAWIVGMWDQKKMYDFYKGAWTIFHQLSKQQEEIHLALTKTIGCYQASGIYNIKEMQQWVYAQAEELQPVPAYPDGPGSAAFDHSPALSPSGYHLRMLYQSAAAEGVFLRNYGAYPVMFEKRRK